jgi:hypothetical protein
LFNSEQKDERSVARDDDKNYWSWYHKSKIANRKSEIDMGVYAPIAIGVDSIDL